MGFRSRLASTATLLAACTALTALSASTVSRTAFAQSPTPPPPDDGVRREEARVRFQRGVELIQQARWLDAIGELEAARQLRATPPVLFNLGLAQRAVGRNREATRSFSQFLDLAGPNAPADLATQARGYIRDLAGSVARLELRVEPANATTRVDGEIVQANGSPLTLDPGRHVIVVDAERHGSETRSIEARAGGTTLLAVRLIPRGTPTAFVQIEATVPEAAIRIDDRFVGNGRAEETLPAGRHVIVVVARGYGTFRRDLDALPGTRTNIRAALDDQRSIVASPWFWLVTGALVAGGAITAGILLSRPDDPYRGSWGLAPGFKLTPIGSPR